LGHVGFYGSGAQTTSRAVPAAAVTITVAVGGLFGGMMGGLFRR
jgi:hypothetical protein